MFRRFSRILLLAFLVLAACNAKKSDPEAALNEFFHLLHYNQLHAAFDSTAFGFQVQQGFANFQVTVRDLGLANFSALEWTQRTVKENEVSFDGEITHEEGEKERIAAIVIKQSGAWKLYALHMPREKGGAPLTNKFSLIGKSPSFDYTFSRQLPSDQEIVALVRETLMKFNDAIKQKSFFLFYNWASLAWKAQLSEKRLQRAFQPFIDQGITLEGIETLQPYFDPAPQLNADGILLVSGNFPTEPYRTDFRLKYIYEMPKWKLFGIDVDLVK